MAPTKSIQRHPLPWVGRCRANGSLGALDGVGAAAVHEHHLETADWTPGPKLRGPLLLWHALGQRNRLGARVGLGSGRAAAPALVMARGSVNGFISLL